MSTIRMALIVPLLICTCFAADREIIAYATNSKELNSSIDDQLIASARSGDQSICNIFISDRKFASQLSITLPTYPESQKSRRGLAKSIEREILPAFKTVTDCLSDDLLYVTREDIGCENVLICAAEIVYSGDKFTTIRYRRAECLLGKNELANSIVCYYSDTGKEVRLKDMINPDKEILLMNSLASLCEAKGVKFLESLDEDLLDGLQFYIDDKGMEFRITNPADGSELTVCIEDEAMRPILRPKVHLR
ncbi:MAG: hypothetical protein KDC10_12330 [Calditrichaeota bacterium]|nr:hypothetical protein [Calditrichota bacterium]